MPFNKRNPLFSTTIGSPIDPDTGKISASVFTEESKIYQVAQDYAELKTISGNSNTCYSESMNRGSFSYAGSYGASGIAKFKNSVTAYLGQSEAKQTNEIQISFNYTVLAGTKYIDFSSYSSADLVASLKPAEKTLVTAALEAFTDLSSALNESNVSILDVVQDKQKYPALYQQLQKWIDACDAFEKNVGQSFVCAVDMGGFAGVITTFKASGSSSASSYGGALKFTYSGIGASTTVGATYDGSQQASIAEEDFDITGDNVGRCTSDFATNWVNKCADLGLNKLWNTDPFKEAPAINSQVPQPDIPEQRKPPEDKKVTGLIDKITDLDGLQAFAQAQAYESAKEKQPDLMLNDFLAESAQTANFKDAEILLDRSSTNSLDTIDLVLGSNQPPHTSITFSNQVSAQELAAPISSMAPYLTASFVNSLILEYKEEEKLGLNTEFTDKWLSKYNELGLDDNPAPKPALTDDNNVKLVAAEQREMEAEQTNEYVTIGAYILKFSDIFPWLNRSILNSINNVDYTKLLLKVQTISQDFLALSKMYQTAHLGNLSFMPRWQTSLSFRGLSGIFSVAANDVLNFLKGEIDTKWTLNNKNLALFLAGLNSTAQMIYKVPRIH